MSQHAVVVNEEPRREGRMNVPVTVTRFIVRSFHGRKEAPVAVRNSDNSRRPDRRRGTHTPEMLDKCRTAGEALLIIKLAGDNCRVVAPTL